VQLMSVEMLTLVLRRLTFLRIQVLMLEAVQIWEKERLGRAGERVTLCVIFDFGFKKVARWFECVFEKVAIWLENGFEKVATWC
jgi:hypothetical protein